MQESRNMSPTTAVPLSEKVSATALTSGGLTFPWWIDYFDHWLKIAITLIYFFIAVYTLQKQVIRPILAARRHKRKAKTHA